MLLKKQINSRKTKSQKKASVNSRFTKLRGLGFIRIGDF
jgi:hypothetical protein